MPTTDNVLTISELTWAIKSQLNEGFRSVWVSGEISGVTRAASGHVYLTLKDSEAQLSAIIWRSDAQRIKFQLEQGLSVVCRGGIDVYAQRGTYQLIIRAIEPAGLGGLELAFRQLHQKLQAEGLFDPAHKKPLPPIPQRVAIVTSPTGAAVRDFLQVAQRRWPALEVLVVPVPVQGPEAAPRIARAIQTCQLLDSPPEVIVVSRGGGSIEDLWAFNEEVVVRAIHACQIPVISGVGHEVDVTLSDLVADVRALTPSDAALRLVPNRDDLVSQTDGLSQRLRQALLGRVELAEQRLLQLASRPALKQPLSRLGQSAQELDLLERSLVRAVDRQVVQSESTLETLAGRLHAISPLAVLGRGYSLTQNAAGDLVVDCQSIQPGDTIATRLASGELRSVVTEIHPDSETEK